MNPDYQRLIDGTHQPSRDEILRYIGKNPCRAWMDLTQFLDDKYAIQPETVFYGVKYGWLMRYRKSGKTLCSLFPEKGAFSVLIVLGSKQAEQALQMEEKLSPRLIENITTTTQLHDGRWVWIRILSPKDIDDVKRLLLLKQKFTKP